MDTIDHLATELKALSNIFEFTKHRCIEEQEAARSHYAVASQSMHDGEFDAALHHQFMAGFHHSEARLRLERLLDIL